MLRRERGEDRARSTCRELNFHLLKGNDVSISRISHSRVQQVDVSGYIAFPNEAHLVRHYPEPACDDASESEQESSVYPQASGTRSHPHETRNRITAGRTRPAYPSLRARAHVKSADEVWQCASPVSRAGIERKLASWRIVDFLSAFPWDSKSQGISNFAESASRVLLLSLPFSWRRDRRAVELDL